MADRRGFLAVVAVLALAVGCAEPERLFPERFNVGVAPNSPGWGTVDPATNERSGFDDDLLNWLGAELDFRPEPLPVRTADRERELQPGGRVSMVLASYSITDARREKVLFAGPYMLSQQGALVLRGEDGQPLHPTMESLRGKAVCVTRGSTSAAQVREYQGLGLAPSEVEYYEECFARLRERSVAAMTTDQLLLHGYTTKHPDVVVLPQVAFGQQERYGIGFPKGDAARCEAVAKKLRQLLTGALWEDYFQRNLPGADPTGHKPDPNDISCG
ncbi:MULTISPECIES: transporter substrate-binding domain-containing protein [Actinosynnema]|uniref:transporter substrate-binding domain-containing protein n=1 Tax=Actinosynnema TaxID=40566 RepID=UPI0020A5D701|nr:transporter substrate-binding domain-containing protein [Actinosynnema pretiosum]MCP2095631.1 glutamate transport system substrate-binding protein [Actinosynnema pretiosum]